MYHSVAQLDADPHGLSVSPSRFRAQMIHLKQHFPLLRLEDEWAVRGGPSVVVTFDDGYANNLHTALPILEDVGVPATIFLGTGAIESGEAFWWDEIDALALGDGDFGPALELETERDVHRWPSETPEQRRALHAELPEILKRLDCEPREGALRQLRAWAGGRRAIPDEKRPMTIDEVHTLAASPLVTIGAHGVSHTAMSAIPPARQRAEIAGSKQCIETWLRREVAVFAYPYGGRTRYSRESLRACEAAGFRKAVAANFPGQAHRWTNRFEIPRQMVEDWDGPEFGRRLADFFTC